MKFLSGLGLALTLIGTCVTGYALLDDHRANGTPLIRWWPTLRAWFARSVMGRVPAPALRLVGDDLASISSANSADLLGPAADAPIEQQVHYLREQVAELRKSITQDPPSRGGQKPDLDLGSNDFERRRKAQEPHLDRGSRSVTAGNLRRGMLGLLLIGIGSVLSFVPIVTA